MFIKQLLDFDWSFGFIVRLCRVNVELEKSTNRIVLRKKQGTNERSLAVVVDRIRVDVVQRTQQLAGVGVSIERSVVQWRPAMQKKKKIFVLKLVQSRIEANPSLSRSLPVAPQAISIRRASSRP